MCETKKMQNIKIIEQQLEIYAKTQMLLMFNNQNKHFKLKIFHYQNLVEINIKKMKRIFNQCNSYVNILPEKLFFFHSSIEKFRKSCTFWG